MAEERILRISSSLTRQPVMAAVSTISELTALGVPAVLVPSPYVANNHQEKNARVLERSGGAVVLREETCTAQELFRTVCTVLHDKARLEKMEAAMAGLGIRDATERIYGVITGLCEGRK